MGYYSFYRIIKDIAKTLFGHRFWKYTLIILIAFTIFFTLGQKGVFAAYDVQGTNGITYKLPDNYSNYKYFLICKNTSYPHSSVFSFAFNEIPIKKTVGDYDYIGFKKSTKYSYCHIDSGTDFTDSSVRPTSGTETAVYNSGSGLYYLMALPKGRFGFLALNFDLKDNFGNNVAENTNILPPKITTPQEDFENLSFDYITVEANNWSDKTIYALFYDRNNMTSESTEGLYPIKEIPLSKEFYPDYLNEELSTDDNSVFWIPNNATGLYFVRNGNYEIRLAERIYSEDGGGGFRDENENYSYSYLGDAIIFSISDAVSDDRLNLLNNATKELQEKQRHDETIGAINKQTDQDKNFYDGILSNQYDENQAGDTLHGMGGGFRDSVDDSNYVGLFSTVVSKFASIINGDYSSVDKIEYPIPNSDKKIIVTSDILYNVIKDTFLYNYLQIFWTYLFGMYIFKFSYGLIKAIKTGSILDGYSWENEVITSSML